MCRTANPPASQQTSFVALALFLFAFCLILHFLAEDTLLYSAPESSKGATSAHQISIDEAEHQDDLVMLAELPQYPHHNEPPVVSLWFNQGERQAYFPILTPPKVA